MKLSRLAGAGMLGALAVGSLTGCEVTKHIGGICSTNPPVPHQNYGYVYVDVEVPPEVTPGSTFTIRIDHMGGYPGPPPPHGPGSGQFPTGVISITGPVTPAGTIRVGKDLFSGAPYPNHWEVTVTGEPGEEIRLGAVSGNSIQGQLPNQAFGISCTGGDAEIVTIPIVAPAEGAGGGSSGG